MQRYFVDVKSYIEREYPTFRGSVVGGHFPPPPEKAMIALIISYIWIGGIILIITGNSLFKTFGIPEPAFVTFITENRMPAFFILFMLNNFGNGLSSTGAFEIYYGDEVIFSRLAEKRFPTIEDIHFAFETLVLKNQ